VGRERQHQRGLAAPGHAEEATIDRLFLAVDGGDYERVRALARLAGALLLGLDEQAVEPAGLAQCVEVPITGPFQKGAVGIEQRIEPVDQDADR